MSVLWQFTAGADAWDGTATENPDGHGAASITDTYDFNSARTQICDPPGDPNRNFAFKAYAWRQNAAPPAAGLLHRIVFDFSVKEWGHAAWGNCFFEWRTADVFDSTPIGNYVWTDRLAFHVNASGNIFEYFSHNQVPATGRTTLVPGTLYHVEIRIALDVAAQTKTFDLYVDDVLDYHGEDACHVGTYPPAYVEIVPGYSWGEYVSVVNQLHDQAFHFGDLVWTIEGGGVVSGRWTMNAIL